MSIFDNIAKEETPGTPVGGMVQPGEMSLVGETGECIFPIIIGDGSPEIFTVSAGREHIYPASQYPHVTFTPATCPCDGPGCDHVATLDERLDDWLIVAGKWLDHNGNFCSLMCLARWLAGELAKEETKASDA